MLTLGGTAPVISASDVLTELGGADLGALLTTAELAARLDVSSATVSQWRSQSKAGKRYADTPFPEPDAVYGQSPVWSEDRLPEVRAWMAARPGMGVGGGRPRKDRNPSS